MKPLLSSLLGLFALLTAGCVGAQPVAYEQPVPVVVAPRPPSAPEGAIVSTVAVAPLDQLVAPIALYPDPLVALILPASTMSSDVVLAARYFTGGGDPQQVDGQGWDDSVKGLAHYPEVVKWMDENLAWTQQLGAAYLDHPGEVMAAVQRVRAQARAKGLLVDTPQQQVVAAGETIEIVPAQPDVIYIPRYDPEIIFVDRPGYYYQSAPWLTFGVGCGVGWWLSYDFDWHRRVIWIDRDSRNHWRDHDDWRDRHRWRQSHFPDRSDNGPRDPNWQQWHPTPGRPQPPHHDFDHDRRPVVRPTPLQGTPHFDRGERHDSPVAPRIQGGSPARITPPDVRRARPERPAIPTGTENRGPAITAPHEVRPAPGVPRNRDGDTPRRREPNDRRPAAPTAQPGHPAPSATQHPAPAVVQEPERRIPQRQAEPPARVAPAPAPAAQPVRPVAQPPDRTRGPVTPDQRRLAPAVPRQDRSQQPQRDKPADDSKRAPDDRNRRVQEN